MSYSGQYIYSVIISALFVAILLSIIPGKSAVRAAIKLTAGIFLIIIVIVPLVRLQLDDTFRYVESIETDASQIISEAQSYTDDKITEVIKQQVESYILNKASEFGADIKAEITFCQDNLYIPESVTIFGSISPLAKKQLSSVIINELGIPEEFQVWT